jgi:hydrogenase-4 membrane subunit HyfE
MHLLNVLYYHFYLFYVKFDPEPEVTTLLSLSACQSFLINGILDFLALKFFCYQIPVWIQFTMTLVFIFLNYLLFYRTNKVKQIIKSKPTILNSKALSIISTILFFLITVSWLFWGPIYGKHLLGQCK